MVACGIDHIAILDDHTTGITYKVACIAIGTIGCFLCVFHMGADMAGGQQLLCIAFTAFTAGIGLFANSFTARGQCNYALIPGMLAFGWIPRATNLTHMVDRIGDFLTSAIAVADQVWHLAKCATDHIPLGLGSVIQHMPKAATLSERITVNAIERSRKCYNRQIRTSIEGSILQAGHAVADHHTGKAGTVTERITSQGSHTIRNSQAGQGAAAVESIIANGGHRIRNRKFRQAHASNKHVVANAGQATFKGHSAQTGTPGEHASSQAGHTCGNRHAAKAATIIKGIIADMGHIRTECNIL